MAKTLLFDGYSAKSLSNPNLWPQDVVNRTMDEAGAYGAVAWCYRATTIRANAVSAMPFLISRKGKDEEPVAWKFAADLPRLLWLTEASLCMVGGGYWFRRRNRLAELGYEWMAAHTIKLAVNSVTGQLDGFTRRVNQTATDLTLEDVVWFWLQDPSRELGPGRAPMQVALAAAGVAKSIDDYSESFFKRGAIPAVILSVDGSPDPEELKRLELWWKKLLQGVKHAWETVAVKAAVKPQIIGQPNKDLAMPELQSAMRAQIAVAFGVPQTMMEDAAQVATRVSEDRAAFYDETIIPECKLLASTLNQRIFDALGLELAFHPEKLDIMQEDEAKRAGSLKALKDAGLPLDLAMELLGYKLTDEQKARLMEEINKPKPEPVVVQAGNVPNGEPQEQEEEKPPQPAPAVRADLERWQRKCEKAGKARPFESESIPDGVKALVEARLAEDVESAFDFLKKLDPARVADEQRVREALTSELAKQQRIIAKRIVDAEEVDWEEFSAALRNAVDDKLVSVYTGQALREAMTFGIDFDVAVINKAAWDWATRYTYDLVAKLTDTTRAVVQASIGKFTSTPGMTIGDLTDVLEPAFGEFRAERIAVTETTRAYSAATDAYQGMLKEGGLQMERIWNTSADEKVCEICNPLDGKAEDDWSGEAPPAHINCRCWTTLKYVGRVKDASV